MLTQGIELTLIGVTSIFSFLILLIAMMYVQAFIFEHLDITDPTPDSLEEDEMMALAIAVKLKNN